MSRQYLMSWIASSKRWKKMHLGKEYWVSCRQLGTGSSKEASWGAANAWWRKMLAEIESQPVDVYDRAIVRARQRLEWGLKNGDKEVVDHFRAEIANIEEMRAKGEDIDEFPIGYADSAGAWVWEERLRERPAEAMNVTVGFHRDNYLTLRRNHVSSKSIGAGRYDNIKKHLAEFVQWIGKNSPLADLTATQLHNFYLFVLEKKENDWSAEYCRDLFHTVRAFYIYLAEIDLIPLPKNINSKLFKLTVSPKTIDTFTVKEVAQLYSGSSGQFQLHVLLMLNCGMTQQDISDLRKDEVDWKEGRIRRKRSKTSVHENVPIVDYKLWGLTFRLLKKFKAKKGNICLLTERGNTWVKRELVDGKLSRTDNVRAAWLALRKSNKIKSKKSIKYLRKTSSTLLGNNSEYSRYAPHFLGHSPRSIADRHYITPSREQFDEALAWLEKQFALK